MADENIVITNLQNSNGTKTIRSSLDGVRYTNSNIGAGAGGVDIAIGATGLLIQTGTNNQPTQQNTIIYDNTFTNSVGNPLAPTTTYSTDLMTIAKLDSTIPAVQLAPTSNTLKVNDTFVVSSGASDEISITPLQLSITDGSINIATLGNNYIDLLLNGGDTQLYMTNDPNNLGIDVIDGVNSISSRITPSSFILNDGVLTPSLSYASNLVLDGSGANVEIKSNAQNLSMGDTQTAANGTILLINDTHRNIDLDTINLCMYGETLALPICYTSYTSDTLNYTNINNWDVVNSWNMTLPTQFFSPNINAVSQNWKIEFSINLRNCNPNGFYKENALYIEFRDTNGNPYIPFLYTQTTPWTRHSNASTYSATSTDMLTYNWNDYVFFDMTTLQNASPLEVRLWWYSSNTNTADFDLVLSITRTNLV